MLDRIGGEVARATSVVRYSPGARFPSHTHGGGEEFYVLEGVFSDSQGDYGAGYYVRNPPGTAHAPWTEEGCTLFVKLRQMRDDDCALLHVDTARHAWMAAGPGLERMALYEGPDEHVALYRLAAEAELAFEGAEVLETLVLSGAFDDDRGAYGADDWLRLPAVEPWRIRARDECRLYVKRSGAPQSGRQQI
jgi:anti-sigma factor ChrR (cupin superfamily)